MNGQHGDVIFKQASVAPESATKAKRQRRGIVVALGEVTGHAHVIPTKGVDMLELDGRRWVVAPVEWTVVHEEHKTLTFPPGTYEIIQEREWSDEDEPIAVRD